MFKRALLALPILLMLAGCGGGSGNLPTPSVPGRRGPAPQESELSGRIVYGQSFRSETDPQFRLSLYAASADGTNAVRLTPPTFNMRNVTRVAPDSSRVTFIGYEGETREDVRYVVNLDGSGLQRAGAGFREGALSPDGRTVAYTVFTDSENVSDRRGEIFLAPADGSGTPRLFKGAGKYNFNPSFSPDGKSLIYVADIPISDTASRKEIIVAPLDGSNARVLVSSDVGIYEVVFSPDGRRIAYTQSSGQSNRFGSDIALYTADCAGRDRRLIADDTDTSGPNYSPDGRFIAYNTGSARRAFGSPEEAVISIYIARADGSSESRLFQPAAGRGNQYEPQWIR